MMRAKVKRVSALLLAITATLTVGLGTPAVSVAFETLAQETDPSPVSALGDRVVWSSYRSHIGRYVLVSSVAGGPAMELPVAPRRVPFDVDLGLRDGHEVAAYSRCQREKPTYVDGRGCRIYVFSLATARETPLKRKPHSSDSVVFPSVSGGRIAFVATRKPRRGRPQLPAVYVAALDGTTITNVRKVGRGSLGILDTLPSGARIAGPLPNGVDLSGRVVAFGWRSETRRGCPVDLPSGGRIPPEQSEIWLAAGRTRPQRIARACSSGYPDAVLGPSLEGNALTYGIRDPLGGNPPITTLIRFRAGVAETLTTETSYPISLAVAGAWAYASLYDGQIVRFPATPGP